MNKIISKEIDFNGKKLILETGELAEQANMAVKATHGDTVLLVTVVSGALSLDTDFFPLTVNYEERLYASGSIKSSRFVKRDGRSTDEATITKRLIDHAIRPLFPKDYMYEVQVVITVLSLEKDTDPEVLAMMATSAALFASDIPWKGPMFSARVGLMNGELVLNPSQEALSTSDLNLIVSFVGKEKKLLAMEAEANIVPEEKILEAIEFARSKLDPIHELLVSFASEVNPENKKQTYVSRELSSEILADVREVAFEKIDSVIRQKHDKTELKPRRAEMKEEVIAKLGEKYSKVDLSRAIEEVEKDTIQKLILDEGVRPDGRGIHEVRELSSKVSILPRTHGSGLFTRGVTQVLTVATLGSPSMEMLVQNMYGEEAKRFMHFYNFPPFSTGETGRVGSPKSREIGHGMLAEKALKAVIPSQKDFPYTIILVSETLSSSGSSSMASTCGSTLALMDAGVPIKEMVAGVGVGLIINDDFSKHLILTDLAYLEDAYGFLDFKMTGTRTGVTAIQVDMKASGIPTEWLKDIFAQSTEGRMHVLDSMEKTITAPRSAVSEYAPKSRMIKIDPSKIGAVIGTGGKIIKDIQEKSGCEISIEEDGTVVISGVELSGIDIAYTMVDGLTRELHTGEIYDGTVTDILDFGALVEILPGKTGLLHISEITNGYVKTVDEFLKIGDVVKVKIMNLGHDGKIGLSKKALEPKTPNHEE